PRRRHRRRRRHPHHLHAPLPVRPLRPPPHPGDGVMKISGTATLHAPPGQVWMALNDPAVLTRTIPGCEHLEAAGPASYRLTLTIGVASIQGTYTGQVSLTDQQEPTSSRLAVNLAGAPGTLHATVLVLLVPSANGSTEVTYAADAIPDGMIASVGQRLLPGPIKKLPTDFLPPDAATHTALPSRACGGDACGGRAAGGGGGAPPPPPPPRGGGGGGGGGGFP